MLESFKSVQAKQFLPLFFGEAFLLAREKHMLLNGYRGAHGRLLVMGYGKSSKKKRVDRKQIAHWKVATYGLPRSAMIVLYMVHCPNG